MVVVTVMVVMVVGLLEGDSDSRDGNGFDGRGGPSSRSDSCDSNGSDGSYCVPRKEAKT